MDKARLSWQCRRGMLEVELLLNAFIEHGYNDLNATEKQLFEQLLCCSDAELCPWLLGQYATENTPYTALIEKILACT